MGGFFSLFIKGAMIFFKFNQMLLTTMGFECFRYIWTT
jgi:hypothetical protein